jgi:hypothetical protein
VAIDPQSGNVFVDHGGDVVVYDSTGAQVDSFTLTGTNSQGLAFGSTAGHLYDSDRTADNVTIYGPPTTPVPAHRSSPPSRHGRSARLARS